MNTAASSGPVGGVQTVVPGTEGHVAATTTPTKPKRKRGPSKKTREALDAARAEGFDAGQRSKMGIGLWIALTTALLIGGVTGYAIHP